MKLIAQGSTVKLDRRCEICFKLTIKTPKQGHWHRYGVFEHTSQLFLPFHFYCWLWTGHYLLEMTVQIVISLSWLVSFDQCHIINWRKLKKLIGKCFPKQNVEPQKPQNLKKILRKSQASNAWATIFKNADFS